MRFSLFIVALSLTTVPTIADAAIAVHVDPDRVYKKGDSISIEVTTTEKVSVESSLSRSSRAAAPPTSTIDVGKISGEPIGFVDVVGAKTSVSVSFLVIHLKNGSYRVVSAVSAERPLPSPEDRKRYANIVHKFSSKLDGKILRQALDAVYKPWIGENVAGLSTTGVVCLATLAAPVYVACLGEAGGLVADLTVSVLGKSADLLVTSKELTAEEAAFLKQGMNVASKAGQLLIGDLDWKALITVSGWVAEALVSAADHKAAVKVGADQSKKVLILMEVGDAAAKIIP